MMMAQYCNIVQTESLFLSIKVCVYLPRTKLCSALACMAVWRCAAALRAPGGYGILVTTQDAPLSDSNAEIAKQEVSQLYATTRSACSNGSLFSRSV